MSRKIEMVGKVFGRLEVIGEGEVSAHGKRLYEVKCTCGTVKLVDGVKPRSGSTQSCGCLRDERATQSNFERSKYPMQMNTKDKAMYSSRVNNMWHKRGIIEEEYISLLDYQKGACPICERSLDWCSQPNIDHDHKTGKVRALLCQQCNVGLGSFTDNIRSLWRAILYLIKHRKG